VITPHIIRTLSLTVLHRKLRAVSFDARRGRLILNRPTTAGLSSARAQMLYLSLQVIRTLLAFDFYRDLGVSLLIVSFETHLRIMIRQFVT
jgi:hypothetical protein